MLSRMCLHYLDMVHLLITRSLGRIVISARHSGRPCICEIALAYCC